MSDEIAVVIEDAIDHFMEMLERHHREQLIVNAPPPPSWFRHTRKREQPAKPSKEDYTMKAGETREEYNQRVRRIVDAHMLDVDEWRAEDAMERLSQWVVHYLKMIEEKAKETT